MVSLMLLQWWKIEYTMHKPEFYDVLNQSVILLINFLTIFLNESQLPFPLFPKIKEILTNSYFTFSITF